MNIKTKVTVTSDGKKFEKALKKLSQYEVRIGFQEGENYYEDEDNQGDKVDILDVAMWNELGTETSPSRPFMRDAIDKHEKKLKNFIASKKDEFTKKMDHEQLLKESGLFIKDLIQEEIRKGDFVPNAPSTISKKGSSRPLIDTGQLRQSVNYVVRERGH